MGGLPLHPALVHVPLGLAFLMPVIAAAVAWSIGSGKCPARSWLLVVALQALLVGTAIAAIQTGEDEAERVERRVSDDLVETHEERAEVFAWLAGATLALVGAAFMVRSPKARHGLMVATVIVTLALAAVGAAVGHAGGMIVHGPDGLVQKPGPPLPGSATEHDADRDVD